MKSNTPQCSSTPLTRPGRPHVDHANQGRPATVTRMWRGMEPCSGLATGYCRHVCPVSGGTSPPFHLPSLPPRTSPPVLFLISHCLALATSHKHDDNNFLLSWVQSLTQIWSFLRVLPAGHIFDKRSSVSCAWNTDCFFALFI